MGDFSFVQITDHHLLESEEKLRDGFSPGHAFRRVMRHISEHVADKADFIVSTGDLVDPPTDETYQAAKKLLGIQSSASLPGPQKVNVEEMKNYPIYFLPGNHDDRALMTQHLFPDSQAPKLYNLLFEHKGVQFVFMDWGQESKAYLFPETKGFLSKSLESEFPSVIVCHQQVKQVGSRWMDGFLADNLDEFWNVVLPNKDKVLGVLCGHIHHTYDEEYEGVQVLGLQSTAFPFKRADEPLPILAPPQYRFITIQNNVLTSRVYTIPI